MQIFDSRVNLKRFEKSIQAYERQPIKENLIMFYGSSLFSIWKEKMGNGDLEKDILNADGTQACVNHGFGGSTMDEMLYYYDRMIRPWHPKVLVLKGGANDQLHGYSSIETIFLEARIMDYARIENPGIQFIVNGLHPNSMALGKINRWRDSYNDLLKSYAHLHEDCIYTNYADSPLFFNNPEDAGNFDKIRRDIYSSAYHFNKEGFELCTIYWKEILDKYLKGEA